MLKPCPFCGGTNITILKKSVFIDCLEKQTTLSPAINIECNDCDVTLWDFSEGKNYSKRVQVITAKWNERAKIEDPINY